jgi:hypothetical protein
MSMLKYTVQPGDTLYLIAKKILGDGSRYMDFVRWNPYTIPDPNKISVGDTIMYVSPEKETQPYVPPSTGVEIPVTVTKAPILGKIGMVPKVAIAGILGIGIAVMLAGKKKVRANPYGGEASWYVFTLRGTGKILLVKKGDQIEAEITQCELEQKHSGSDVDFKKVSETKAKQLRAKRRSL